MFIALPKDTIGAIIDGIISDTSSFITALILWLKENTPRLPIEINNEANNEYLKYKSLIFKKELPSEEAEKINPFYNILARMGLLLLVT